MDLTPQALRSAQFREKIRGYHPDDVDSFLEAVAEGLEVLLTRLRETSERARRAEAPPADRADNDEAVRTLALAQRTADMAIKEAREEAERLVGAAEARAKQIVGSADEVALATATEAQATLRADLGRLQSARDQLDGEVRGLGTWVTGERARLRKALTDLADRVETVRDLSAPPAHKPVDVPEKPRVRRPPEALATPAVTPRPKTSAEGTDPSPPAAARSEPAAPAEKPAAPHIVPAPAPVALPVVEPESVAVAAGPPDMATEAPADPDAAVLARAGQEQRAVPQEPRIEPAQPEFDDDPYFAELRRAMTDAEPLGPRDDEPVDESDVGDILDRRRGALRWRRSTST